MAKQLTKEAIEILKSDAELFGQICDALDVRPVSLPRIIIANHRRLTEAACTALIAEKLGKPVDEIIEDVPIVVNH